MAKDWSTNPPAPYSQNPFDKASEEVVEAREFAQTQLTWLRDNVLGSGGSWLAETNAQILALGAFEVPIDDSISALVPEIDPDLNLEMDISDINQTDFGSISPYSPGSPPSSGSLPSITTPTIPTFTPSISGVTIKPAPGWTPITQPGAAPTSPTFTYPDAVEVTFPDAPDILRINLPAEPSVTLPTLTLADFPTLTELDVDTLIPWTEPSYTPEVWTDVKAQILTFLAGGTGIRPDVEEAIVNRGRDREDRIVRQQIQQALEEWNGRGYTAPPGMLVKRMDTLRDEATLKKLGLQRDVVIKAMEEEIANLRFAVQQGIAAEDLFIRIHLAMVDRLFMVQRLHIEFQIQSYNLMIQVYQARLQENSIRAQVYEVQVRAALAEIEVFKALIEAESVKADINKSLVDAYRAEIEARQAIVDVYVAQVQAVKVQADVFNTRVTAHRNEVEAYAARVEAEKIRFDAYESEVRGELAKTNIIESEARAYQAQVSGIETGVRAEAAALEGAVSAFRAEIEAYDANLRSWTALNQNELAQIQANVEGHRIDIQRFVAEAGVEEASKRLETTIWESGNRIAIEAYQAEITRLNVIMEKAIQQAGLLLEAIKSSGDLASTISAGALAAMHVGATTSGSSSLGASGSQSHSFGQSESMDKSCSTSQNTSISYESDSFPSYFCGLDE